MGEDDFEFEKDAKPGQDIDAPADDGDEEDGPDSVLPVEEFIGPEESPTRRALRHLYDAVVVLMATGEVESTVQLDIALENAWSELMWTAK